MQELQSSQRLPQSERNQKLLSPWSASCVRRCRRIAINWIIIGARLATSIPVRSMNGRRLSSVIARCTTGRNVLETWSRRYLQQLMLKLSLVKGTMNSLFVLPVRIPGARVLLMRRTVWSYPWMALVQASKQSLSAWDSHADNDCSSIMSRRHDGGAAFRPYSLDPRRSSCGMWGTYQPCGWIFHGCVHWHYRCFWCRIRLSRQRRSLTR